MPKPLSVVLKISQPCPCLCSLSMVLTHPAPSILFSPKVPPAHSMPKKGGMRG